MNYLEPLMTSSVDFNKIVYPKTKNCGNKKLILIKYNDKSKLKNFVFQTPTLSNLFKPELNGNYTDIELALVGKEKRKVNKFKNFLNELETKIKTDAQYHAASWFNIDNDNQTINFQKIVRDSDIHSEGTIKIKIINNNDFETVLQLNNNKKIGIDAVPEDSWCKVILECYGVWINTNNDFGIFFRPILISFTPKEKEIYNYQFIKDSDEDSDEDNNVDIPDTEVNHDIFMKIDSINDTQKQLNESTSQLDYHNLMKNIKSEKNDKHSEIILSILNPDESSEDSKNLDESSEDSKNPDESFENSKNPDESSENLVNFELNNLYSSSSSNN
jgi:hypothetical protein